VVIEKQNASLLGYDAPRLHQLLGVFFRKDPDKLRDVPLAQHCVETLPELFPQSPGPSFSDPESVECRMPHKKSTTSRPLDATRIACST
jgi:hypothetical protein